ncbi:MAG TPA: glycosyltransferase [Chitinophagales bacterium]|nr:glycosyltransferase [Chitinophagales bacterium]
MKCILLGTAYPYRGGLAAFNERLVRELIAAGHDASIITFTLQYPNFLFPGKTQFSDSPPPDNISIQRKVNSINPFNWWRVGKYIQQQKPDLLIIKYWLPFMAPCFSTIARIAKKNGITKVICIADNIIPHEPKFYDNYFTNYFIKQMDGFVVMSNQVLKDLAKFNRNKLRATTPHPLFDNFGAKISKQEACNHLKLEESKKYILFFGFIRDYKGLDILLEAFWNTALPGDIELIVAGEFYTDKVQYIKLIPESAKHKIHLFEKFISDEEVKYFFCAADLVVQPYKHATQSGVTQIAYHFEVPMIVTDVGGLAEMVPDNEVGYVVQPHATEVGNAIRKYFSKNAKAFFIANMQKEKKRFGWNRIVGVIMDVYGKL